VTSPGPAGSPATEAAIALAAAGAVHPGLRVVATRRAGAFLEPFRARFPDRAEIVDGAEEAMDGAARTASLGSPRVVAATVDEFAGRGLGAFRDAAGRPDRAPLLVVALEGDPVADAPLLDDVALLRGLPRVAVVVPADAPTAVEALRELVAGDGPAYLRLGPGADPVPVGEPFQLGRARELRAGDDLTIAALGAGVGIALAAAQELARVGVGVRVLDLASVKPVDAKALRRAARETGAILTIETQQTTTGVGTLVAALVAEHGPVPVRRLGAPDLPATPPPAARGDDAHGVTVERALEEAWELLRAKGKVH